MANFNPPSIEDISDKAEGVYTTSGAPIPTETPAPPTDVVDHTIYFEDMDSGSYSVIRMKVFNFDTQVYSGLEAKIDFNPSECNSSLFDVFEKNGSDTPSTVTRVGNSLVINFSPAKRNSSETMEVAFKTKFNHTFHNDKHPENSLKGSFDGYSEDGKQMADKNIYNFANVRLTLTKRLF